MKRNSEAWRAWPLPEAGTTLRKWQAGRCAWCGEKTALIVDHCHRTGLVRGMLCRSCNNGEGFGGRAWDAWRDGDHPARAIRHVEVYVSTYGRTALYPEAALSHYTSDEQEAWWAAVETSLPEGGEWPTEAPWTEAATARRESELAALKAAIDGLGRVS